jgi:2,3,4,5-tetrahydropyridine-2-carboxylate N-succinyltransferase
MKSQLSFQTVLDALETGEMRAASPDGRGGWKVNVEVKEAILAAFKAGEVVEHQGFLDKHTLLPRNFTLEQKVRIVPGGSSVRRGAHLAKGVIVMPPSYVNVGAFVGEGSMVDSHVLVGSCAQIGARVHLSAAVQIGGVLEPVGAQPVIIEDSAFIGAGCVVVEGIRVGKRAVLAPGVILSRATRVLDLVNERELEVGEAIPDHAVVVPGSRPVRSAWGRERGLSIASPLIVKYRDEKTDASLALEEMLR